MELVSPQADKFDRSLKCYTHCPLRCAGNANKGVVSLFKKEIPLPYTLPEKIHIAGEQLEELRRLPNRMPARGVAALALLYDASAPTTCCRSAYLVEVRSNHRLPEHSSMRRAQQCRYFARSLPPFYRHSRLTTVRRGCCQVATRRDSWRSHVHRTRLRSACSSSSCNLPMSGSRGSALAFSWGIKRGPFSHVREWPPFSAPLHGAGIEARYRAAFYAVQQNCTGSVAALSHSSSSPLRYGEIAAKTLA